MTPFETILIGAIGTAILGLAGFITWIVKYLLPKVVEAWEKKDERFNVAVEKISTAVDKLPEILGSMNHDIRNSNSLGLENKTEIIKLREDLFDKRIENLQNQIDKNSNSRVSFISDPGKN